ncbi:peroxidase-related enzyme [Fulvivirgaceae bacterium BMA10]|uniref:Peroxidase-related enzyme n=1 Tax=Splendidivirga corallicola TaxID=3051826 RepID=A0ABT8KQA8_9BACT|nr:peroxidase-related enzyme [Fulvivirgaceae bacterium BMA10]
MTWIKTIPYEEAEGQLKKLYDKVKGPDNNVDNILMSHSLRPHSLVGHMAIYKNVLHNNNNTIPKWFLEALGVYVSYLNNCSYCVEHHYNGMKRLVNNDERSALIRTSIEKDEMSGVFDGKELEAMNYAKKLTKDPSACSEEDIKKLRSAGFDDGEILEINQVVSYFCYANRTVLGLGINTDGDILGLSPNDSNDPDNWSHS